MICGIIFLIVLMLSSKFLEDKKAKSKINQGKYILNRLVIGYEKILLQKKEELEKERKNLISQRNSATNKTEKKAIERKLREIELQRRNINTKYEENEKQKKEIQASLKGMKENLIASGQEITRLNQKYLDLSVKKEASDKYWENYVNSIKSGMEKIYSKDLIKLAEIKKEFVTDNARKYIPIELKKILNIISKKDNQIVSIKKELNNEIKGIKKKLNKEIKDTNKELNKKIKKNNELNNLVEKSENAVDFQKKHLITINKFTKISTHYKKAQILYKQKRHEQSAKEYLKVSQEFDEIKTANKMLKEIEMKEQNNKALSLYNKALVSMKSKKYDTAFTQLSTVIKETPASNYTNQALSDLLKIANSLSIQDKISIANKTAKKLYNKAESLKKSRNHDEAIKYYNQIITDYPYSDYIRKAFDGIKNAEIILKKKDFEQYDDKIKKKFMPEYEKYSKYYEKGDIENARKYYFEALRMAFDIYTNNSITEFKEVEDKYIELLLKYSREAYAEKYTINF